MKVIQGDQFEGIDVSILEALGKRLNVQFQYRECPWQRCAEGYYVVFSQIHTEQDALYTEEMIAGKRIYTHIIRTHFEPHSSLATPDELRNENRVGR